jgi:hypothetical protein
VTEGSGQPPSPRFGGSIPDDPVGVDAVPVEAGRSDGWSPATLHWPAPPPERGTPLAGQPLPLPPAAPVPPVPIERRTRRAPLILAAVLAAAATVALGSAAGNRYLSARSPESVVRGYFAALAHGDAARALAYADGPLPSGQYLTDRVLGQQLRVAQPGGLSVTAVHRGGARAAVEIRYELHFADRTQLQQDAVDVVRRGTSWRLVRIASTVQLPSLAVGSTRVTVAGRPYPVPTGLMFPGALPVVTDSAAVLITSHPVIRLQDATQTPAVQLEVSAAAVQAMADGVQAALLRCLAGTAAGGAVATGSVAGGDPLCPVVSGGRPVPGSLRGTLTAPISSSRPGVVLSPAGGGLLDLTVEASVDADWKVWDFDNIAQPRHEATTVTCLARASIADPGTVYWRTSNG